MFKVFTPPHPYLGVPHPKWLEDVDEKISTAWILTWSVASKTTNLQGSYPSSRPAPGAADASFTRILGYFKLSRT